MMLAATQAGWWENFERALLLRDSNTLWVVLGVLALGIASGTVGAFLVLRRRALTADAISHATLPGIAVAFILMIGGVLGAQIGASMGQAMRGEHLRALRGLLVLIVGVRFALNLVVPPADPFSITPLG